MTWIWSGLAALVLAGAHLAGGVAGPVSGRMRSFAGGVGVGYVFIVVLPALSTWQGSARQQLDTERLVFAVAMAGLVLYYLLEVGVERLDQKRRGRAAAWVHISGFALYSAIVGFILAVYADRGALWLMAYTAALSLHVYMNDRFIFSTRHYPAAARWILAGSVLAGWGAGVAAPHRYALATFVFAALAGGMMLNILKEELPPEKDGKPLMFVSGIGLLILIGLLL